MAGRCSDTIEGFAEGKCGAVSCACKGVDLRQGHDGEVQQPRLHHWLCGAGILQDKLSFDSHSIDVVADSMPFDIDGNHSCKVEIPVVSEYVEVVPESMVVHGAAEDYCKVEDLTPDVAGIDNATEEALAIHEGMHFHLGGRQWHQPALPGHGNFGGYSIGSAPTRDPNEAAPTDDEAWNNCVIDHISTYYLPEYRKIAKRGSK